MKPYSIFTLHSSPETCLCSSTEPAGDHRGGRDCVTHLKDSEAGQSLLLLRGQCRASLSSTGSTVTPWWPRQPSEVTAWSWAERGDSSGGRRPRDAAGAVPAVLPTRSTPLPPPPPDLGGWGKIKPGAGLSRWLIFGMQNPRCPYNLHSLLTLYPFWYYVEALDFSMDLHHQGIPEQW